MAEIIYLVINKPGGVGGKDPNDPGGQILFASFREEIARSQLDAGSRLEARAIDRQEILEQVIDKLNAMECLVALRICPPARYVRKRSKS